LVVPEAWLRMSARELRAASAFRKEKGSGAAAQQLLHEVEKHRAVKCQRHDIPDGAKNIRT